MKKKVSFLSIFIGVLFLAGCSYSEKELAIIMFKDGTSVQCEKGLVFNSHSPGFVYCYTINGILEIRWDRLKGYSLVE